MIAGRSEALTKHSNANAAEGLCVTTQMIDNLAKVAERNIGDITTVLENWSKCLKELPKIVDERKNHQRTGSSSFKTRHGATAKCFNI